jgi:hypothetical protein
VVVLVKILEVVQLEEDGNVNMKFDQLVKQFISEKQDRCHKKANQVYGKKNSLYKGGAIAKCRKGKIWKT